LIDDDLALEDAVAFAVEHRLEALAADAAAGGMGDDQRVIDVLAALKQIGAVDSGLRALAAEPHESLVAHHRAAEGKREILVSRILTDFDAER
jgi:hypothetical protein